VKEFIYPVSEVAAWTGRTGDVALRHLQEMCPDELGIHPDQKRWAVTYAGAHAYVKRIIADDLAYERRMAGYDRYVAEHDERKAQEAAESGAEASAEVERKNPAPLAMTGAMTGGARIGQSPSVQSQMREASLEARARAEAEFDKKNPKLSREAWERKFWKG